MSYILDALRKSEKERSTENIPTLGPVVHGRNNHAFLTGALIVISAIAVAAILYIVWSASVTDGVRSKEAAQRTNVGQSLPVTGESPAQSNASFRVNDQEPNQVEAPTPVAFADLDPKFRGELPALSLNVVSFSGTRDKSFVMLNQGIYKEGQSLDSGVQILKINQSGVVLAYRGRAFFLTPN